mmetsp:Transcript_7567/g.46552  ORF Transcript_7567/g.46552 Transcript_7567/m.46552 type:complete len:484 (-) Transcript_7567:1361-2812(-)
MSHRSLEVEKAYRTSLDADQRKANGTFEHHGMVPEPIPLADSGGVAVGEYDDNEVHEAGKGHDKLRTLEWTTVCFILTTEVTGLGCLSLPQVASVVGYGGFVVSMVLLGIVATWTGVMIQNLKTRNNGIFLYCDVGDMLYGVLGYRIMLVIQTAGQWVVLAGNALTTGIALTNVAAGSVCLVVWFIVAFAAIFFLTQLRTLHHMRWILYLSLVCIIVPVTTTLIDVPLRERGIASNIKAFNSSDFKGTLVAILDMVFAFGGHSLFFVFLAEMREPRDFKKALYWSQAFAISFFVTVGLVLYLYGGDSVSAPALNMLATTLRRVMYGVIVIHTIPVATLASVAIMQDMFPRFYGWDAFFSFNWKDTSKYMLVSGVMLTVSWAIVESIPFFSEFLSLGSSIATVWLTYGVPAFFAAENQRRYYSRNGLPFTMKRKGFLVGAYAFAFASAALAVAGLVAVIMQIASNYEDGEYGPPFTCDSTAYYP